MFTDRAGLPQPERDALEKAVSSLTLLADVVRWAFSRTPPLAIADVVLQDEYTHDVLVPWGGGRCLVFGTT